MAGPTSTNPWGWWKGDSGVYEDAGTDAAENGDLVYQWNDSSGNSRHMSQTTSGNRMTYRTNSRNSLPGVESLRANSTRMSCTGNCEPKTLFMVVKRVSKNFFDGIMAVDTSDAVNCCGWHVQINPDSGINFSRANTNDTDSPDDFKAQSQNNGTADGGYYLMSFRLTDAATDTIEQWQKPRGVRDYDTTSTALRALTGNTFIGCDLYGGSPVDHSTWIFYEIILYDTTLSDQEMAQVQFYLHQKWGFGAGTTTPDGLAVCFTNDGGAAAGATGESTGEALRVLESNNAGAWFIRPSHYAPAGGYFRDGSHYDSSSGAKTSFWLAHTNVHYPTGASTSISIAKSVDGGCVWTEELIYDLTGITGIDFAWAPEWAKYPDTSPYLNGGYPSLFISVSTDGGSTFSIYETHPTNAGFTTWSTPVVVTGTSLPSSWIDAYVLYDGSNFYLHYKLNTGSSYVEVYKSSSLTSGYASHRTGDWTGSLAVNTWEGPCAVRPASLGVYRIYVDRIAGGSGTYYVEQTSGDYLGGGSTGWGSATAITHDLNFSTYLRHGTFIFTPAASAKAPPPFTNRTWRRWPRRR